MYNLGFGGLWQKRRNFINCSSRYGSVDLQAFESLIVRSDLPSWFVWVFFQNQHAKDCHSAMSFYGQSWQKDF